MSWGFVLVLKCSLRITRCSSRWILFRTRIFVLFFNIILKTSTNHVALASNVLRDSRAAFLGELNGWTLRQECHRHAFHRARHAPVGLGRPIRHYKRNDKSSLLYAFRGVHHMAVVFILNDIFSKIVN